MAVTLSLGPVTFADFEIPQEIPFGGSQKLVVKKLVGGDRVIDAMGRDDMDIRWSGRFRGELAEVRARQLDLLRVGGLQQILSWSTLRYLVVVDQFQANFQQPFEIPYTISCTVIADLSLPILPSIADVDSLINTDINSAEALDISSADVVQALAGVAAAVSLVGRFQGASAAEISGAEGSIQTALTAVETETVNQNTVVAASGSVAGMVGGTSPVQLTQTLSAQAASFGQLGQLYQLKALLGRTSINIANAGS